MIFDFESRKWSYLKGMIFDFETRKWSYLKGMNFDFLYIFIKDLQNIFQKVQWTLVNYLKTPQNVVISVCSHTRSNFNCAHLIFFVFFREKMTFSALLFHVSFHWIVVKDSIRFVEYSYLRFSDFIKHGIGFNFLRTQPKPSQRNKLYVSEWQWGHSSAR